jgi:periplasmic divalent cation tolerance protein
MEARRGGDMSTEEKILVFTTTEKKKDAEDLAKVLVENRLAACVQIVGPIRSIYRWKGNVESADEWLCLIKSKKNLFNELEKTIKENHPYETPEITATPIVAGSAEYLGWMKTELKNVTEELVNNALQQVEKKTSSHPSQNKV